MPARPEPLQGQLQAVQPLYEPDGPIRVHFALVNRSDEPVDVPLDAPHSLDDGVTLPVELVLGAGDRHPLSIAYNKENPETIMPPAPADAPRDGTRTLRLAPHGAVGAEVDLRASHAALRYPGVYRVEWRPLDGRLGVLTTTFRVEPRMEALLVTDYGKITFVLDYDHAPRNVENFLDLIRGGFYDNKTIQKVIPGFLFQAGCPKGDGTGIRPDGKLIPAELRTVPFDVGTLAMAHKKGQPDTASCQFYVGLGRRPDLDGQYTVVGQANDPESLRTLQQIAAVPADARYRPLNPLRINSINLSPADRGGVHTLEGNARRGVTSETSTAQNRPPASQPR